MIERGEEREAKRYLNTTVAKAEKELNDLSLELEKSQSRAQATRTPRRRSCWAIVDDLVKKTGEADSRGRSGASG